jgi:hypothetical protein
MEDYTLVFRSKLSGQAEVCARKTLEILQKDLQNTHDLSPSDIFYLASAAQLLLTMRDYYGEK